MQQQPAGDTAAPISGFVIVDRNLLWDMLRRYRAGWRWSNVPIPEPHVAGLIIGTVLHKLKPMTMAENRRRARAVGVGLSWVGGLLIMWSLRAVGEVSVENPTTLVTTGPYAFSRNPMYIGWSILYLGLASIVNTIWLFVVFPAVVATSHWSILQEERALERDFDEVYRTYRCDVPRYL